LKLITEDFYLISKPPNYYKRTLEEKAKRSETYKKQCIYKPDKCFDFSLTNTNPILESESIDVKKFNIESFFNMEMFNETPLHSLLTDLSEDNTNPDLLLDINSIFTEANELSGDEIYENRESIINIDKENILMNEQTMNKKTQEKGSIFNDIFTSLSSLVFHNEKKDKKNEELQISKREMFSKKNEKEETHKHKNQKKKSMMDISEEKKNKQNIMEEYKIENKSNERNRIVELDNEVKSFEKKKMDKKKSKINKKEEIDFESEEEISKFDVVSNEKNCEENELIMNNFDDEFLNEKIHFNQSSNISQMNRIENDDSDDENDIIEEKEKEEEEEEDKNIDMEILNELFLKKLILEKKIEKSRNTFQFGYVQKKLFDTEFIFQS
jgi:hypothetical protein